MRLIIVLIPLLCGCSTPVLRCDCAPAADQSACGCHRAGCCRIESSAARRTALITLPRSRSISVKPNHGTPIAPRSFAAVLAPRGGWPGPDGCVLSRAAIALCLLMPLKRVDPFRGTSRQQHRHRRRRADLRRTRSRRGSRHPVFSDPLSDRLRALQFRDCGKRLRGMRRVSFGAAQSSMVRPVDRHQSRVSPQRAQGRKHSSRAGHCSEFLHPRQRAVRPGSGAVFESCASGRPEPRNRFTHWVATVQYVYAEPAKDPEDPSMESARLQDR